MGEICDGVILWGDADLTENNLKSAKNLVTYPVNVAFSGRT